MEDTTPTTTDETVAVLKEILALQKTQIERQQRALWILVPIFAVLCIQAVLALD